MISLISSIVAFVTNSILLVLVARKGLRNATHLTFFLLILSYIIYVVPNYFVVSTESHLLAVWMSRIVMSIAIFQTVLFYIFAKTFPNTKPAFSKSGLRLLLAYSFGVALFCLTPWVFSDVEPTENGAILHPEFGVFIFGITTSTFIILGIYHLVKKYKTASGICKTQLLYIIIGTVIMHALFFCLAFIFSVVTKTDLFPRIAALFFLPFTILTAFAITRHRLFDIRLVIKRWFIKSIVVVVISGVSLGIIYSTNTFTVNPAVLYTVILLVIITAALVMNYIFDHYFTRVAYDISLPEELKLIENAEVALTQLRRNVIKILRDTYGYETTLFFLYDWREKIYRTYQNDKLVVLPADHSVISMMSAGPTILTMDELKENKTMPVGVRSEILQFMKRHHADIIIPLYTELFTPGIMVAKRIDPESKGIQYKPQLLDFTRKYGHYMERTLTFDALVRNQRTE